MAIQLPNFSVPILSPASLLDGEDDRNPLQRAMDLGLQEAFIRQRMELEDAYDVARQQRAAQHNLENTISYLLGTGALVPKENIPELPDQYRIPTTVIGGREFAARGDVEAAQRQYTLDQPLHVPGRRVLEGTRLGDVVTPDGRVDQNLLENVLEGNVDYYKAIARNIPSAREETKRAAFEAIEALEADFFSQAEGRLLGDQLNLRALDVYAQSAEAEAREDRQLLANIAKSRQRLLNEVQIVDPQGDLFDMPPSVAQVFALAENGMQHMLTPEQESLMRVYETRLRPRDPNRLDRATQMDNLVLSISTPGRSQDEFVAWLDGLIHQNGSINQAVAEDIRAVGVPIGPPGLRQFAQSPRSMPYRLAYALWAHVGQTHKDIEQYILNGNRVPGNLPAALDAMYKLYGDKFGDTERISRSLMDRPRPGQPVQTSEQRESVYLSLRNEAEAAFRDADPQIVNSLLSAMAGSPQEAAAKLLQLSTGVPEPDSLFADLAKLASDDPGTFLQLRDSIYLPAAQNIRR